MGGGQKRYILEKTHLKHEQKRLGMVDIAKTHVCCIYVHRC